ncbi:MAG: hypothetical protein B7Z29_21400 [Hyphomicrobium sp. 12-62-95]|nr:MAG: hypothetical protein B7Z29_21400 [Hyphomicrobium sp. 12-62-95]
MASAAPPPNVKPKPTPTDQVVPGALTRHSYVAQSLSGLADLRLKQKKNDEAIELYEKALSIQIEVNGPRHGIVAGTLSEIASAYIAQSNWTKAAYYSRAAADILVDRTLMGWGGSSRTLVGEAKSDAERSPWRFIRLAKVAFRIAESNNSQQSKTAEEMFVIAQWAMISKVAASMSQMAVRRAVAQSELSSLVRNRQDLFAEWQRLDLSRIAMMAEPRSEQNTVERVRNLERLADLKTRIGDIDGRLTREFPDFSSLARPEPITIRDVQKLLPVNDVLVVMLASGAETSLPGETLIWAVTRT